LISLEESFEKVNSSMDGVLFCGKLSIA